MIPVSRPADANQLSFYRFRIRPQLTLRPLKDKLFPTKTETTGLRQPIILIESLMQFTPFFAQFMSSFAHMVSQPFHKRQKDGNL